MYLGCWEPINKKILARRGCRLLLVNYISKLYFERILVNYIENDQNQLDHSTKEFKEFLKYEN